jgi:hypothetical protein
MGSHHLKLAVPGLGSVSTSQLILSGWPAGHITGGLFHGGARDRSTGFSRPVFAPAGTRGPPIGPKRAFRISALASLPTATASLDKPVDLSSRRRDFRGINIDVRSHDNRSGLADDLVSAVTRHHGGARRCARSRIQAGIVAAVAAPQPDLVLTQSPLTPTAR